MARARFKPVWHHRETDPKLFDKLWPKLRDAIREIYEHNIFSASFHELYSTVYTLVLHKHGSKLYEHLTATFKEHLEETLTSIGAAQDELFLEEIKRKWAKHNNAVKMIGDIMMYFDRTYILTNNKTLVFNLGMELWREIIMVEPSMIQGRLHDAHLGLIRKERFGEAIHRSLRSIIEKWTSLGPSVYQEDFERPFLEMSATFYSHESQYYIEHFAYGEYLKHVEKRLDEERTRVMLGSVSGSIDIKTYDKITDVVVKEMLANLMQRLILMDRYDDLTSMYNLFSHVAEGGSRIISVMASLIMKTGKSLVTGPDRLKDPVAFVQRLLNEKDKYENIINVSFSKDKSFLDAMNSSFGHVINLNNRSPEFLSLFVDDKLRKEAKEANEEDPETILDKVMMLFRYLQEKDLFEKYYKQHLAKRLLTGKAASDDSERSMLVKLKTECGYQFTSKMEGMFTDMNTSHDITQDFYAASSSDVTDSPMISVQILTTGSWPTQPCSTCNLPPEILAVSEKFRDFYLGTHKGRRLTWQTNMGTADIKATFGNGSKHELNVSTYQMCVLMLFNSADALTYREIEQATAIPAADLKRCLQSLALVKGKQVLRKEPMSKDISDDDSFCVNDKFTSKFFKVKIGTVVAQEETDTVPLKTRQRIDEDRKPQIEAAIVRIMKSRRVLDHNSIMTEVTKQLQPRFLPNPIVIKKRIESLIEREFLERDEKDMKLYHYVA